MGRLSVDGKLLIAPHGRAGLAYFLEHITATSVLTNRANGKTVTTTSRVINHDLRVTDNGDGTLTILFQATGNDVIYGADGKAIGRNPGQIRLEFLIDHSGTPTDPSDDVFLAEESSGDPRAERRLLRNRGARTELMCMRRAGLVRAHPPLAPASSLRR